MQTSQFLFKRNIWLMPLAISVFSLFSLSSCKEKAPKGSCVALTRSKINKEWVKPGYIKDINYMTFITCYNPIKHEISVGVQAYDKDYKAVGEYFMLATGDAWKDDLPPLAVGKNNIELADLNILESGKLKDFAFVNLVPYGQNGYLWYNTTVVDKELKSLNIKPLTAYPCPPCVNCKPPCPINCDPPCSKEDSANLK